jgi:hypothetical protein
MQLKTKFSLATTSILLASTLSAEDFVRVNVLQYDENDDRISVTAPSIEVNKEFGVDYTLNASLVGDALSGGTPIYVDTSSGATAYNGKGTGIQVSNIKKQNVQMTENRSNANISLTQRLENRDEISYGFSKSYESDYDANTLSLGYLLWADDSKNRSYDFGLSYSANEILIKDCDNNYVCTANPDDEDDDDEDDDDDHDGHSGASAKKSSSQINFEVGMTQIIDKNSLYKVGLFYSNEDGYLSNPYYTVVRNNNGTTADVVAERRPDTRVAYGLNLKYIRAMSKNLTSHFKYKYYTDDWDINSHTIDIQNYYELNSKFTFGFGARFYSQSEANFYNASTSYFTDQKYASHDDRLSDFSSTMLRGSVDFKYNDKINYNVGVSLYDQSTDLSATTLSLGVKYKF